VYAGWKLEMGFKYEQRKRDRLLWGSRFRAPAWAGIVSPKFANFVKYLQAGVAHANPLLSPLYQA
jgi:hypothetical protein